MQTEKSATAVSAGRVVRLFENNGNNTWRYHDNPLIKRIRVQDVLQKTRVIKVRHF